MTVEQLYEQSIKPMSASDRLRLATMILNEIPPQAVVDYSEEWTEEDMRDFTAHSLRYFDRLYPEEDDLVSPR